MPRMMMSTLKEKEKGDENRYFREQEAKRMADLRANVEKILASKDDDRKEELVELLSAKPAEGGALAAMGLNDWKFALPVGLFVAIPTIANEVLVLNAESQLVCVFILFCSTMYTAAGSVIASSLDSVTQGVRDSMKSVDDNMLKGLKSNIKVNEGVLTLAEDVKALHTIIDDLAVAQADALNKAEEHKYREAIIKKLDSLVALEESATAAIKTRMLTQVKNDVVGLFSKDAKAKENALNAAIAVLTAGPGAKMGKDVVGEAFQGALKSYKESYSKGGKTDPILAQLEKDMAAIATAPAVDGAGGNVYVTHPLLGAGK